MRYLITAMAQLQVAWLLLLPFLLLCPALVRSRVPMAPPTSTPAAVTGTAPRTTLPGCPSMCGNISIPYPFGIGKECSWNSSFNISCNYIYNPPRAYLGKIEVVDITLEAGELRVFTSIAHICYDSSETTTSTNSTAFYFRRQSHSPFQISPKRNQFTGIGCNTLAFLQGRDSDKGYDYLSGCVTTCTSVDKAADDGNDCTGLGCCQTSAIPSGLDVVKVGWSTGSKTPTNRAWNYSRCSFAFVAEKGWYKFSRKHLNSTGGEMPFHEQLGNRTVKLVLDWAIEDDDGRACKSNHSERVHVDTGDGRLWYRCNCSDGYSGNPYIDGGCQNINECQHPGMISCPSASKCVDTDGDYECKCNFGRRKGPGCPPILPAVAIKTLSTFVASVLLLLLLWIAIKGHKRRQRRGFFDRNGGKILKGVDINIFTKEELKRITNNYSTLIGKGAFGMVFMGTTDNNQKVAVKRTIVEHEKNYHRQQGSEFVDEITFQFQIRHENLVRLVGCCLETEVPMLVFQYIPKGSLHDVLHGGAGMPPCALSLMERLDIAIGSAEALAYMHSHAGHNNRIHGDVKSGNILLDDELKPKVSDFGSSKLVSIASRLAEWGVSGDMNYIDPEYIRTGRFTEKSDIYSFGVVLLELATRKKVTYDGSNSLTMNFVRLCKKDGNGRRMYDRGIFLSAALGDEAESHPRYMECLDRIGALAVRCLKEDMDERPTMAETVEELKLVKLRACGDSNPRRLSFESGPCSHDAAFPIIREPTLAQLQGNTVKQKDLCLSPGGSIRNRHSRG